jgi:hypothetical protein
MILSSHPCYYSFYRGVLVKTDLGPLRASASVTSAPDNWLAKATPSPPATSSPAARAAPSPSARRSPLAQDSLFSTGDFVARGHRQLHGSLCPVALCPFFVAPCPATLCLSFLLLHGSLYPATPSPLSVFSCAQENAPVVGSICAIPRPAGESIQEKRKKDAEELLQAHLRIVTCNLLVQTSPGPNFSLASPNKLDVHEKCNMTPCIRYMKMEVGT